MLELQCFSLSFSAPLDFGDPVVIIGDRILYGATAGGKKCDGRLDPFPAPVAYRNSGPMEGGFLHTARAEAETSAFKSSQNSVPPLHENQSRR